jgi:hypothetical protein
LTPIGLLLVRIFIFYRKLLNVGIGGWNLICLLAT